MYSCLNIVILLFLKEGIILLATRGLICVILLFLKCIVFLTLVTCGDACNVLRECLHEMKQQSSIIPFPFLPSSFLPPNPNPHPQKQSKIKQNKKMTTKKQRMRKTLFSLKFKCLLENDISPILI